MPSGPRAWFARVAAVTVALMLISAAVAYASADERSPTRTAVAATPVSTFAAPVVASRHARPLRRRPGSVFVTGDSLTVGVEPWLGADLQHEGWRLDGVDARIGRPVAEGLQVLRDHATTLPGTVVVALGTNDLSTDPSMVASWLATAREIVGHRRLIWVNLCPDAAADPGLSSYRAINAALAADAPQYGVQVADWCAFAHAHGVTPGADHIHYTASGYQLRAQFYADVIAGMRPST